MPYQTKRGRKREQILSPFVIETSTSLWAFAWPAMKCRRALNVGVIVPLFHFLVPHCALLPFCPLWAGILGNRHENRFRALKEGNTLHCTAIPLRVTHSDLMCTGQTLIQTSPQHSTRTASFACTIIRDTPKHTPMPYF